MEAGLKQNKIEALNAASWSFKIIIESLLTPPGKEQQSNFKLKEYQSNLFRTLKFKDIIGNLVSTENINIVKKQWASASSNCT